MPKGYALSEATKEAIWELRAQGLSEREIGRQLGLGQNTVGLYLRALGGIRPRPRRRARAVLDRLEEREEISRAIARGQSARQIARALGRSHTTIVREINRCGGRRALPRPRSRPRGLAAGPTAAADQARALRRASAAGPGAPSQDAHSPEQIAGWLRIAYPDNESMQVSHETIYRALYVQARGRLKRELTKHLRKGRSRRYARSQSSKRPGKESSPTW